MPPRRSRSHFALPLLFALAIAGVMPSPRGLATLPTTPQPFAQAPDGRKAEGDRLLEHGIQQFKAGEYPAAEASLKQALRIYRVIKDRNGEAWALRCPDRMVSNPYF